MIENRKNRTSVLACTAIVFVLGCGVPDEPLAPEPPEPPAPLQVVGRLTMSGSVTGAFVGLKVRLSVQAFSEQGIRMSSDRAIVTSSDAAVVAVTGLDVVTINEVGGRFSHLLLLPQISMLASGTAVIRASLQGVTDSVVVQVRALPMLSTALVVDTFTVVEYRVCPDCVYLGYAPLLRLREPSGTSFADVIAVEFNVPTRTTGWCTGELRFTKGQTAHVNGIDPYPWFNDMVFFQINGTPLPEGPATARVIVRDATGTWGMVEATAPIKRAVIHPDFPSSPVGLWSCQQQESTQ
jgi:hypothetical protein